MGVRVCAGVRGLSAPVFKWFTIVCVFALARVRERLINNTSSENQVVYYIIVTERKALQDEQAKF